MTTTNAGTAAGASATLTVLAHPAIAKAFAPAAIGINGTSTLTITLTNPNAAAITGAAFTDTYPANLVNATPASGATTCAGGTVVTAANGGASVALARRHHPGERLVHGDGERDERHRGQLCEHDPDRTRSPRRTPAPTPRRRTPRSSSRRRSRSAKSFTPASIGTNGTSVLTITLTNPNALAVTGAAFTDSYPANLVNTASASGATTCAGGTVTAANNGTSVALAGGTVPASGSCTVTVNVTSATAGCVPQQHRQRDHHQRRHRGGRQRDAHGARPPDDRQGVSRRPR